MRPDMQAFEATRITTAAAVAVCRAIEDLSSVKPEIKWVNDVFVNGKKVCGILTEASFSMESGTMEYVIPGIGINVYEPEGGFPPELQNIAGAIFTTRERDLRSRLTASFLGHFYDIASSLDGGYIDEYRSRSFLIGKRITVIRGQNRTPALALDVDDSCHLVVRYDDGTVEALSSGEVSVRPEDTPC
jgi:BirA family biotin operon repressor/biotin-[acetyl-CoA-carboxylase] ligase